MMIRGAATLISVAALTMTGCGGDGSEEEAFDVKVEVLTDIDVADLFEAGIDLGDDEELEPGHTPCRDSAGNIERGTEILVKDADGKTIATGHTGDGVLGDGDQPASSPCVFEGTIDDVPTGERFYEISVGGGRPVTLKEGDLLAPVVILEAGYSGDGP